MTRPDKRRYAASRGEKPDAETKAAEYVPGDEYVLVGDYGSETLHRVITAQRRVDRVMELLARQVNEEMLENIRAQFSEYIEGKIDSIQAEGVEASYLESELDKLKKHLVKSVDAEGQLTAEQIARGHFIAENNEKIAKLGNDFTTWQKALSELGNRYSWGRFKHDAVSAAIAGDIQAVAHIKAFVDQHVLTAVPDGSSNTMNEQLQAVGKKKFGHLVGIHYIMTEFQKLLNGAQEAVDALDSTDAE